MLSIPDSRAAPSKESWVFHQCHSLETRPNPNATVPSHIETPDSLLKVLSNGTLEAKGLETWVVGVAKSWAPLPGGSGEAQGGWLRCLRRLSLLPRP